MRIGISVAQCGRLAHPAAILAAARAAEQLGYASVWVCDDILDPAGVLAATASVTSRVRLGATLRNATGRDPFALARSLATVDVLSDGRLAVILGAEEERQDELLDALDAGWDDDRRPRPPVLVGGSTPAALERVARRGDGWAPTGVPVDDLAPMWARVRDLAAAHGRDPAGLRLTVRAGITLGGQPLGAERPSYAGDADQVADDVDAARRMGADEIALRLLGDLNLDEALDGYARIAEAAELRARSGRATQVV